MYITIGHWNKNELVHILFLGAEGYTIWLIIILNIIHQQFIKMQDQLMFLKFFLAKHYNA